MTTAEREARIRALLARAPARNADMIRRQRESFVYGNLAFEEPRLTMSIVLEAIARVDARK